MTPEAKHPIGLSRLIKGAQPHSSKLEVGAHVMHKHIQSALYAFVIVALAAGCSGSHALPGLPVKSASQAHQRFFNMPRYVIVMVQENRSVDNLFQTQPGVDTQNFGMDSHNNRIQLQEVPLGAHFSCGHTHSAFVTEVTVGFDLAHGDVVIVFPVYRPIFSEGR